MIEAILHILLTIILPIFILIAFGVLFDRAFKPDRETMSKLNFYFLVPALIFIKMIDADLAVEIAFVVGVFSVGHFFLMFITAYLFFSIRRFKENRSILSLGSGFFNAGNYGIPLVIFAFGETQLDILAIILILQNIILFSFGLWIMERGAKSVKAVLLGLLRIPSIYAVLLGLLMRFLGVNKEMSIMAPLEYMANAVIPVALITLGIGLSRIKFTSNRVDIAVIIVMRLVVSPLIAFLLALVTGISTTIIPVLVVTAGLPVAVNVYILSLEYHRGEEIASQAVFWTTLLSAVTISFLLAIFSPV